MTNTTAPAANSLKFPLTLEAIGGSDDMILSDAHGSLVTLDGTQIPEAQAAQIVSYANAGYASLHAPAAATPLPSGDFKNVTSRDVAVLLETLHDMYEFTEQVAPSGDYASPTDHIVRADLIQQMREWLRIYASLSTSGYVEILELLHKCSTLNHYEVIRDTTDILAAKRKAYDIAYRSPDVA